MTAKPSRRSKPAGNTRKESEHLGDPVESRPLDLGVPIIPIILGTRQVGSLWINKDELLEFMTDRLEHWWKHGPDRERVMDGAEVWRECWLEERAADEVSTWINDELDGFARWFGRSGKRGRLPPILIFLRRLPPDQLERSLRMREVVEEIERVGREGRPVERRAWRDLRQRALRGRRGRPRKELSRTKTQHVLAKFFALHKVVQDGRSRLQAKGQAVYMQDIRRLVERVLPTLEDSEATALVRKLSAPRTRPFEIAQVLTAKFFKVTPAQVARIRLAHSARGK